MSNFPNNYGSKVVKLRTLLEELGEELRCEFSYAPDAIPRYETRSPHLFGRFPWYYELVSRGRALYMHMPNEFFCGISFPWKPGVNGFLKKRLILVRPEVNGSIKGLVEFAHTLAECSNSSLVLKHVHEETATRLLDHGFRYYAQGEGWDENAIEDDQTFDEVIIDIAETLKAPPHLQRSKSKATQWTDAYHVEFISPEDIQNPEVRSRCKHEIILIFYEWLKHIETRKTELVDEAFLNWHLSAFDTLVVDERLKLMFVRNEKEEPIGVFSLATMDNSQVDVVFSFISLIDGDAQRLAYRAIFVSLSKMGIQYMNLGGSEFETLFNFKRTLGALTLIKARHLVLDFE